MTPPRDSSGSGGDALAWLEELTRQGRSVGDAFGEVVQHALHGYFRDLQHTPVTDLYDFVMTEVERPLLRFVMDQVEHNQSRAAEVLGISRGTLRKKLKAHDLL